jgi:hypothetical protein
MTDRQLMQQVLRELEGIPFYRKYGVRISNAITALQKRLAQCDRCGKKLGGEGDIHTCTPDPIGDAQDKLIAEMAAQPEQEPVAWIDPADYATLENDGWCVVHANAFDGSHALHSTTPPAAQRQPLTNEEMWRLWNAEGNDAMNQQEAITFARAIEAAHGIKEQS